MFLSSGILQSPVGTWFQGIRVDLGIDSGRRDFLQVPPPFGTDLVRFGDSAPRDFHETSVVSSWFLAFPKA